MGDGFGHLFLYASATRLAKVQILQAKSTHALRFRSVSEAVQFASLRCFKLSLQLLLLFWCMTASMKVLPASL